MPDTIAKTEFYSIKIDPDKNRAYLTFYGFCSDVNKIPNFLKDVKTAAQGLTSGFTLLTDASQLKSPTEEVAELHKKSQTVWIENGLSKTAELMPESTILQLTLKRFANTTGMPKKEFHSREQAESWLDSK